MRYAILLSFTVFVLGPALTWVVEVRGLHFVNDADRFFTCLSMVAFLLLLSLCAFGVEKHPRLVRGILIALFCILLLFTPWLFFPSVTC